MSITSIIQSKRGLKTISLNRRRAVREKCLNCSVWSPREVAECIFDDCPLYPFRSGQGRQDAKARAKAIREFCSQCMAGYRPSDCVVSHCPLFCYRKSKPESPVLSENDHIRGISEEGDTMRV